MLTANDIRNLLAEGEHLTLECKLCASRLPNNLWETYSAFANSYGGYILLGIEEHRGETDSDKRFTIQGVANHDKLITDFWNLANDPNKVNVNLLTDDDVQIVRIDGRDVIAIHVPRADYMTRPVFLNNNPLRATFRRNHEGDYHCSDAEVRMMMRDANADGNDRMLLEYYTMDDIDIPTLDRYRMLFRLDNPDHVWNNLSHEEFLRQLGGMATDRATGKEWLTMAGLLMFGKGLPVRDRFDNLRMDYIDRTDLIGEQRYSDRLTYDGTWENNLFNFMRTVLPRLTRDLPRPFAMEGMQRMDDTAQHKAVREAMTNAIIHADFVMNGILKVEKFDDAFVFTNPGLLKLPVEQIYAGGESKARNQRMQSMLRMIGYGENIGSGFPLILSAWNEKHWVKPELIEQPELLQVKLKLSVVNIGPTEPEGVQKSVQKSVQESREKTSQETTQETTQKTTQKTAQKILEEIAKNPFITREELAIVCSISSDGVKWQLKKLQSQCIIRRVGPDKGGHWEIIR